MKTISKLIIPLFLLCIITTSCSKEKCNVTLLSFNNHLSTKITVRVVQEGNLTIEPGSSRTIHVKPYKSYEYYVVDYWSKSILGHDYVSVDACVSKGVNIK